MTIGTKERVVLEKYISLISDFTSKKITTLDFEKQYLRTFKEEQSYFSKEILNILYTLFSDVDAFCADPELRDELDLDEEQLHAQAQIALKKILKLMPRNT